MSMLEGFLFLDDQEIFNNGRTLNNIRAARAAGTFPQGTWFRTNPVVDPDIEQLGVATPIASISGGDNYQGNYTPPTGTNRRLLVTVCTMADISLGSRPTAITLGGVSLTQVGYTSVFEATNYNVAMWYLDEADIPAGSQVLDVQMGSIVAVYISVSAHCVMLGNVDQTTAPSDFQSNSSTVNGTTQTLVGVSGAPTGWLVGAIIGFGSNVFTGQAPLTDDYSALPAPAAVAVAISHDPDPIGGAQLLTWTTASTKTSYAAISAYMEKAVGAADDDCGCYAYGLNPTIPMGPFTELLACLPGCFTADSLNSLSVDNPWHDDDIPDSDDFLGVWVQAVQGLDGRHNARGTTPRVAFPRGSILGPLEPTHRTISYDITLVAISDCGLSYGMEWLERQLSASCDTCGLGEMFIRLCCPPADDPDYGLWVLKEVGLAEGPEWLDPLESSLAQYVREATVSFYAGNPCRYSKPIECLGWTEVWDPDTGGFPQNNVCCVVPDDSPTFDYAPRITIDMNLGVDSPPLTIEAYERVTDLGFGLCDGAGGGNGTLILSIALLALPAEHRIVLDGALRAILFSGPTTDWEEIDGSAFIDASGGFVQWANLACKTNTVIRLRTTADTGFAYEPPRVLIELLKRGGC